MAAKNKSNAVVAEPKPVPAEAPEEIRDPVLRKIVAELSTVKGIAAIGIGGSRSIGTAVPSSDYDVILFTEEGDADQDSVQQKLEQMGGEWIGKQHKLLAELSIEGRKVELFFRDIAKLAAEVEAARKGQFRRSINALHVIGFLSTILVSYATYVYPLWDPHNKLKQLIDSAFPYPEPLREKMVTTFLTEGKLALIHAAKVRSVNDIAHLMGLYSRANMSWLLVLFAANRKYPVIDKGGRRLVASFPNIPDNFDYRARSVFRAAAGGDIKGAIDEANRLQAEVALCARRSAPAPAVEAAQGAAAGAA
jgi:hypothetical protein